MNHHTASNVATKGTWTNIDATQFIIDRQWNAPNLISLPAIYEIFAVDCYTANKSIRNIHEFTNIDEYIEKYQQSNINEVTLKNQNKEFEQRLTATQQENTELKSKMAQSEHEKNDYIIRIQI